MEHKILEIEKIQELDSFPENLNVRIFLTYPEYNDILHLIPSERIKVIRQRRRDNFKSLIKDLDKMEYKRIGSKIAPNGIEIACTKKEILSFNIDSRIKYISILSNQDSEFLASEPIEIFFAVKAIFAIQIENRTKGLQDYEERILLIKATSEKEAEKKLMKGVNEYEKPYINSYGELVRWKFEEIIDYYEICYSSLEDMLKYENEGIEIFSRLKRRRLKGERIWKIENEK